MGGKNLSTVELFESFFKSKVDSRGRIYLPKEAREKLSVKAGDKIYLEIRGNSFIGYTARATNARASP